MSDQTSNQGMQSASQSKGKGAVAGMVLGIIAVVFAFIPCLNFIAPILALAGLPLSILGLKKCPEEKGKAMAGLVLSIIALVVFAAFMVFAAKTGSKISDALSKDDHSSSRVESGAGQASVGSIHGQSRRNTTTDTNVDAEAEAMADKAMQALGAKFGLSKESVDALKKGDKMTKEENDKAADEMADKAVQAIGSKFGLSKESVDAMKKGDTMTEEEQDKAAGEMAAKALQSLLD